MADQIRSRNSGLIPESVVENFIRNEPPQEKSCALCTHRADFFVDLDYGDDHRRADQYCTSCLDHLIEQGGPIVRSMAEVRWPEISGMEGTPITSDQLYELLRGGPIILGPGRRVVTLEDGPFSVVRQQKSTMSPPEPPQETQDQPQKDDVSEADELSPQVEELIGEVQAVVKSITEKLTAEPVKDEGHDHVRRAAAAIGRAADRLGRSPDRVVERTERLRDIIVNLPERFMPDIQVTVPEREVTVNVPEREVYVNVPERSVNVEGPDVQVNVPEREVHVNVPETKVPETKVDVHIPETPVRLDAELHSPDEVIETETMIERDPDTNLIRKTTKRSSKKSEE